MYLYHGSNVEITSIDYNMCRDTADFGTGFYTTNIKDQAIIWAKRMTLERMGSEYNPNVKAIVTIFNFDTSIYNDTKVKCRCFHGPSKPWELFVKNNLQHNNIGEGDHNLDLRYDLVSGCIASSELFTLLSSYESGRIDKATFKRFLNSIKKSNQYSFHTDRSVKYLKSPMYQYFDVTKEEFDKFHAAKNCIELKFFFLKEKNCLCEKKIIFDLNGMLNMKKE